MPKRENFHRGSLGFLLIRKPSLEIYLGEVFDQLFVGEATELPLVIPCLCLIALVLYCDELSEMLCVSLGGEIFLYF